MKFQTIIPIDKQTRNQIDYNSKILLLGSCFSENIGSKLDYYKFQTTQNPFGILFQPKAMENLILNAINEKEYTKENLVFHNELWQSFDAHSSLSNFNKKELLAKLNLAVSTTNTKIKEASHIIITLGTSWVYRHIESDSIVANCHKIPQKKFLKEILTIDEISESLSAIIALVRAVNKNVNVIFTVSPVRHLKDGFVENTQSKSHLIAGIHNVIDLRNNIHYFPSYEIMMDELRDYRFYAEDMIHPNSTAVNYIWTRFLETWLSENTNSTMKKIETIQKGILHKPFHENSEQHQQFLKSLELKKEEIKKVLSFIKF